MNLSKLRNFFEKYKVNFVEKDKGMDEQTHNVQVTNESSTPKTKYGQGIGSGAGNLEFNNGAFVELSE